MAREGKPVPARVSGVYSMKVQMAGQMGSQTLDTVPVNNAMPNSY